MESKILVCVGGIGTDRLGISDCAANNEYLNVLRVMCFMYA